MMLLTQQFTGNQQTQTFTLTGIHIHHYREEITASLLIQRAIKICSDKKFLDEELNIIKHNLCDVNNYPRIFVQSIINYNLHKRNSIASNLNEGNNSKEIFINLKYARKKGEQINVKNEENSK